MSRQVDGEVQGSASTTSETTARAERGRGAGGGWEDTHALLPTANLRSIKCFVRRLIIRVPVLFVRSCLHLPGSCTHLVVHVPDGIMRQVEKRQVLPR